MSVAAYRVQDAVGRGPWRPGFSATWIDGDAPADRLTESVMDLVPSWRIRSIPRDLHVGCACRSLDALMAWFTPIERERLERLGFHPVRLKVDDVVAESDWQMVIVRQRPFREGATRLRWRR